MSFEQQQSIILMWYLSGDSQQKKKKKEWKTHTQTYIRILFARDKTRASEEQRCACVPWNGHDNDDDDDDAPWLIQEFEAIVTDAVVVCLQRFVAKNVW